MAGLKQAMSRVDGGEVWAGELELSLQKRAIAHALAPRVKGAASAQLALGSALKRSGRLAEAIAAYERAVEAAPQLAGGWSDLASAYLEAGHVSAAIMGFRHALTLAPEHPELHYNVGTAELRANHFDDARVAFEACVARAPGHVRALSNLGVALKGVGRPEDALVVQRRAVSHQPDNAEAQWNLALTEIALGQFAEGFRRYENRTRLPGYPALPGTEWNGGPRRDATLVLHTEQGIGDTFMYLRFVARARNRVRRLLLCVPRKLVRVLRAGLMGAGVVVVDRDARLDVVGTTVHARLPSLPHLLGDEGTVSAHGPYLTADSSCRERLRSVLQSRNRGVNLRVAIAWQGNPAYRADATRSLPLRRLAPVLEVDGASFVSLQKIHGMEQLEELDSSLEVRNLGRELDENGDAFFETAAALAEMDLLITSDSAIAHLAGAMGVDVWLLLNRSPDFRWGYSGETTPWYSSMRLFRQRRKGKWDDVASRVASALVARVRESRA